jgi:hypothetical protein
MPENKALRVHISRSDGCITAGKFGLIDDVQVYSCETVFPKVIDVESIRSIGAFETYKFMRNDYEYAEDKALVCTYLEHAIQCGNHEDFSQHIEEYMPPPVFEAIFEQIIMCLYTDGNLDWLPSADMSYKNFTVTFIGTDTVLDLPRGGMDYLDYSFRMHCEDA